MEAQRILICLALFAACVLTINASAIPAVSEPSVPVNEKAEKSGETGELQVKEDDEHARQKKWAYAYGYGLTAYAAPAPVAPLAYSAVPAYYPGYRAAVPYYYHPYLL